MQVLACGCIRLAHSRSYTLCREQHGPEVGNVLPKVPKPVPVTDAGPVLTPRQARKRQAARDSGRKLKAGRHVLDSERGRVEKVEGTDG